jgi:hypothetical protein
VNVPRSIAAVISSGLATMADLSTVLGVEDLCDLIEIARVNGHNQRIMAKRREGR